MTNRDFSSSPYLLADVSAGGTAHSGSLSALEGDDYADALLLSHTSNITAVHALGSDSGRLEGDRKLCGEHFWYRRVSVGPNQSIKAQL